jgi:hypothetical protein
MRALDGDPEAGRVEELHVVLAVSERDHAVEVEPEHRTHEGEPGSLRHARISDLEHVRQRRREERTAVEPALELGADLGQDGRLRDGDELRRRPLEPCEEVADRDDRQTLEDGVPARVLALLGDVELVVDVDVRRDADGCQRRDRLPRDLQCERLVEEEFPRPRVDDGQTTGSGRATSSR